MQYQQRYINIYGSLQLFVDMCTCTQERRVSLNLASYHNALESVGLLSQQHAHDTNASSSYSALNSKFV